MRTKCSHTDCIAPARWTIYYEHDDSVNACDGHVVKQLRPGVNTVVPVDYQGERPEGEDVA